MQDLLIALVFFSLICLYLGREIWKLERTGRTKVNQPVSIQSKGFRTLSKFMWFAGFFPNDRVEITQEQRPFLYRFMRWGLYFVFICMAVGWIMVLVQLIEAA